MEHGTIEKVELHGNGAEITYNGWTLFVSDDELTGFTPLVGHSIEVGPSVGRPVQYICIDGTVVRDISDAEQQVLHDIMVQGFRQKKLEDFEAHGDEWKAKVKTLLPVLRARMERFEAEEGDEFWIDMGSYELYAIGAADVLARKAMEERPTGREAQLEWITWWDDFNTEANNYDYKRQMEILPEFGDGHSGNTHGAAVYYARRAIQGLPC